MASASPLLSSDALFEILSRVSLQTLCRCRVLCRMIRDLTYESSFMRLNTKRTETEQGYFLQSINRRFRHFQDFVVALDSPTTTAAGLVEISLDSFPGPVKILASAKNGLLLCLQQSCYPQEEELFVCKPTTRQWITIPNPNQRFSGAGSFGLVVLGSEPLRFKVVRVLRKRSNNRRFDKFCMFHIQLFDSDKFHWKYLKSTIMFPFCDFLYPGRPSVEACMALHWITSESRLLTFYCDTESWEITSLPSNLSDSSFLKLVETEGRLGIIQSFWQKHYVDLWIMHDAGGAAGGEKIWRKVKTVEMTGVREEYGFFNTRSFHSSDMVTLSSLNRLIFHNFNNKKNEVVGIKNHMPYPEIFFFQSDFERVCFEEMQERRSEKAKKDYLWEALDALEWDMFYT